MNKIIWFLKQAFPLTYKTTYGRDGKKFFVVWNMWMGRCFSIEEHEVVQ